MKENTAMRDENSNPIRNELESIVQGVYTGRELVFDSETGELIIKTKKYGNPDSQSLDQLAEDGFM
jgi:hypothetical protein